MKRMLSEAGITEIEYKKICSNLGREPNELELRLVGAMWSEHCSYKSTKRLLGLLPSKGISVIGKDDENAGVVELGDGLGLAFKIESHNHPSAVSPYDGAATGLGGVVRDIVAMGARPVACMAGVCLGNPESDKIRNLSEGIAKGIADYGLEIGVPTIGCEVFFHSSYEENPLVNAFCAGVVRSDELVSSKTAREGEWGIVLGRVTNCDGVGSAVFASRELESEREAFLPIIPKGNPVVERRLIDACLEMRDCGLITAMQDMGAAGLISSSSEIALKSGVGIDVYYQEIPTDESNMGPWQVFLSETQERMFIVVREEHIQSVQEIAQKYDLPCAVIARIVPGHHYRVVNKDKEVLAEIPLPLLSGDLPAIHWISKEPESVKKVWAMPSPQDENDWVAAAKKYIASIACIDARMFHNQFIENIKPEVLSDIASSLGVFKVEGTQRLAVFAISSDPWKCALDPRRGAAESVLQTLRPLYVAGARATGITDGLNYSSPEYPERFWEIEQSIMGIADVASALDCPVVSGNVSLYNESAGSRILPTPFIIAAGVVDSPNEYIQSGKWRQGDRVYLVGNTAETLSGSRYADVCLRTKFGRPVEMDATLEKAFRDIVLRLSRLGLVRSARVCCDGGLLWALILESLVSGVGGCFSLEEAQVLTALLGEGGARAVYAVSPEHESRFCEALSGFPYRFLGVAGGDKVQVNDGFCLSLDEINATRKVL